MTIPRKYRVSNSKKYDINLNLPVAHGTSGDIFVFYVPTKTKMVLSSFGNDIDISAAWGSIVWQFLINDIERYPYNNIIEQIGTLQLPREIEAIEVNGGDVFKIKVINNDVAADVIAKIALQYELEYLEV